MVNWFDLMRQAQGGAALDSMARQFGVTPDQAGKAAAAFAPAFLMGIQRAMANPSAMQDFFKLMAAGHSPAFFESAAQGFGPQARQQGHAVLDQLFGSDETSRRVASQAAAVSGIGVEAMQQMLPLMAGIMAGSFARMAGAFAPPGLPPQAEANAPPTPGQTGLGGFADFWSAAMAPQAASEPKSQSFDEMMASFMAAKQPPAPPKADGPNPFAAFAQMMEAGRTMQEQHLAALQAILEAGTKK